MRCPDCSSDDVIPWDDGYICRDCSCEFDDPKIVDYPIKNKQIPSTAINRWREIFIVFLFMVQFYHLQKVVLRDNFIVLHSRNAVQHKNQTE